jgi:hypothetical protein
LDCVKGIEPMDILQRSIKLAGAEDLNEYFSKICI